MILITLRREDSRSIVSIAGRLDQGHLAELREQCAAAARTEADTKLVFDLSELKSADEAAIHWLGKRSARGDEILGASPYIRILLEREMTRPDSLAATRGRSLEEGDQ